LATLDDKRATLALHEKAAETFTADEAKARGSIGGVPNDLVQLHRQIAELRRGLGDRAGALAALEKARDVAGQVQAADQPGAVDCPEYLALLSALIAQARLEL